MRHIFVFFNFYSQLSGFVFNFNLNFDKVKHGKLTILFMYTLIIKLKRE